MIKPFKGKNPNHEKFFIPRSVQQSIPIKKVHKDGVFEVAGLYSKTWRFFDVNYAVAGPEKKEALFLSYCAFLNSLPVRALVKITLFNRTMNQQEFSRNILMQMVGDGKDRYRAEYNDILTDNAASSNNLTQEKYITISVERKNIEEARAFFNRVGTELGTYLSRMDVKVRDTNVVERMRLFHDFFRPLDSDFRFDLNSIIHRGNDFRDAIAPDCLTFYKDHYEMGDQVGRVLFLRDYASFIKDEMITELSDLPRNMMISINLLPIPTDEVVKEIQRRIMAIESDVGRFTQRQNSLNNFNATIPYHLEQSRLQTRELMDDVTTRDQGLMLGQVTITHLADTLEQLDQDTETLVSIGQGRGCQISTLKYQQEDGLNTVLPYGLQRVDAMRSLTTESTAVLMPFKAQEIQDNKSALSVALQSLYHSNVPCRYFIYNSAKLSDVRQFATSSNIEVMIINIDAFKKAENIINQAQDRLNGETAMGFIQNTHPIVIIDEPQSVDNTPKAKEAIATLNPLCVLRYSATHREKINLLYRLTPVDAYQMGLVKQIAVSSNQIAGGFNQAYVRLLSVSNDKGFKARVELDVKGKTGAVTRKAITVKPGDDLFLLSGQRDLYEGYTIAGIDCTPDFEHIEFGNTQEVKLGKAIGDVDENIVKKAQIRRTIETHLDKELRYLDKGIKVLSLFFIDKVDKYRHEDGTPGIYATMFEERYQELIAKPKYAVLQERFTTDVSKVHNGYFSQDKKGRLKDTKGDTQADDDTYNTIMRDKEWLLSFECPLRFIFSHSALREGWDNPNVFQVCTLIEQKSTFTCRQKVGRGLRLCVNQDGERIEDKNINVLHVMANESFSEFASTLQKEIEDETGVKFGVLQLSLFSGMVYEAHRDVEKQVTTEQAQAVVEALKTAGVIDEAGQVAAAIKPREIELPKALEPVKEVVQEIVEKAQPVAVESLAGTTYTETVVEEHTVTHEEATELLQHFEQKGYITSTGKVKDTMKNALKNGTLDLPKKYEAARERFEQIIANADRKPPVRDASRDVVVRLNKQVMLSPEFLELWNKIKQKTAYRVSIDTEQLVENCVKAIREMPHIPKTRLVSQTAGIHIEQAGISHIEREMRTMDIANDYQALPDIITAISDETLLTPATVNRILVESGRCGDFLNNPEAFLEQVVELIRSHRHALAIDGIRYVKLDGQEYYVQEIFDTTELLANLDRNAVKVEHSVYDYVVYDSSTVEKPVAVALDNDPDVKMFFKIPSRFKIETPIGTYNPDWAVYLNKNGEEKLYFVLETKGDTSFMHLKTSEQLKIHCGKEHFKALNAGVALETATSWTELRGRL